MIFHTESGTGVPVLAIHGWMPTILNFWVGHQGYEFMELGRLWQIAL